MLIATKRKKNAADIVVRTPESMWGESKAESVSSRATRSVIRFQFRGWPGVDGSLSIPMRAKMAAMPPNAADNQVAKNSC